MDPAPHTHGPNCSHEHDHHGHDHHRHDHHRHDHDHHGHHHDHDHSHDGHEHGHRHGHEHEHNHDEKNGSALPQRMCGCSASMLDPETLKKMTEERKNEPTLEEKNAKKKAAVMAAKEHGGQLFREAQFAQAFAVYDRAVTIINGINGMSDAEYDEMMSVETICHLNMAACKLQLREFREAINYCKLVLNVDPNNVKALYRKGKAHLGLGDFDLAKQELERALALSPDDAAIRNELQSLRQRQQHDRNAAKQFGAAFARKLAEQNQQQAQETQQQHQ